MKILNLSYLKRLQHQSSDWVAMTGVRVRGFTLIELIIVIAIIGILSSLLFANIVGVRQRAKDGTRKSDLQKIQTALELYRADNGSYPTTSGSNYRLNATLCTTPGKPSGSSLKNIANTITYMQNIPCDPLGNTTGNFNGGNYYYYSLSGTTYSLYTCLENTTDSSAISTAPVPAGSAVCAGASYFLLQQP